MHEYGCFKWWFDVWVTVFVPHITIHIFIYMYTWIWCITSMRWQFLVIYTHFDALDFIPAPCDVTTVLKPRHQNTLTWPLVDLRKFALTFKPLIIYLNLVSNVIALAEYSDFHSFWRSRFYTCALDVTTVLDPRHQNTLTWPLAEFGEFYTYKYTYMYIQCTWF